ncbi:hypothetical protein [Vibrio sp. CyArs1]|uniref:hypothetical protein n=1 Tax=Vibrio sp. CyArs1 TaxID=2682577 RepID=UPI001F06AC7D|nr:hypothetical protein [Vibrio sp. CyArs1]
MTIETLSSSSRQKLRGVAPTLWDYSDNKYINLSVSNLKIDQDTDPLVAVEHMQNELNGLAEKSSRELTLIGERFTPLLQGSPFTFAVEIPDRLFDGDIYYFLDKVMIKDENGTDQPTAIIAPGLWQYRMVRYTDGELAPTEQHPPVWQKLLDIPNIDRVERPPETP